MHTHYASVCVHPCMNLSGSTQLSPRCAGSRNQAPFVFFFPANHYSYCQLLLKKVIKKRDGKSDGSLVVDSKGAELAPFWLSHYFRPPDPTLTLPRPLPSPDLHPIYGISSSELFPPQVPSANWPNQTTIKSLNTFWRGKFADFSLSRELALVTISKCKFPGEGNISRFPSNFQTPFIEDWLIFRIYHSCGI